MTARNQIGLLPTIASIMLVSTTFVAASTMQVEVRGQPAGLSSTGTPSLGDDPSSMLALFASEASLELEPSDVGPVPDIVWDLIEQEAVLLFLEPLGLTEDADAATLASIVDVFGPVAVEWAMAGSPGGDGGLFDQCVKEYQRQVATCNAFLSGAPNDICVSVAGEIFKACTRPLTKKQIVSGSVPRPEEDGGIIWDW